MTCGIYSIRCRLNGREYIGSSIDLEKRWKLHLFHLRRGTHHSIALQRAWKKYGGEEAFQLILLQKCWKATVRKTEQKYLDKFKPAYNSSKNASGGNAHIWTEEARRKMSERAIITASNPEERQRRSERAKAQHVAGKLGRKTWVTGPSRETLIAGWSRNGAHLPAHIASQTSEEMSRRSKMRRIFQ